MSFIGFQLDSQFDTGETGASERTRALHEKNFYKSLYFNRFRGELAISEFDWPFTPFHKSSQSLATDTSEVLMTLLKAFQPVHEKITQFRV